MALGLLFKGELAASIGSLILGAIVTALALLAAKLIKEVAIMIADIADSTTDFNSRQDPQQSR